MDKNIEDKIEVVNIEEEKKEKGRFYFKLFLYILLIFLLINVIILLKSFDIPNDTNNISNNKTLYEENPLNLTYRQINCLTENYKFYGVETCPHCQNQKKYYGQVLVDNVYVDCNENKVLCDNLNINSVPFHYIINSKQQNETTTLVGEQNINTILNLTNCN